MNTLAMTSPTFQGETRCPPAAINSSASASGSGSRGRTWLLQRLCREEPSNDKACQWRFCSCSGGARPGREDIRLRGEI